MAAVLDVAAYILDRQGEMTAMKLQKLVYYSQAWNLVWEDGALFSDRIEAWANGPVVPRLYQAHRGLYTIKTLGKGNPAKLSTGEKSTVDAVLDYYGDKNGAWLSELTHSEPPWRDARAGLGPGERGSQEITKAAMAEYYGSLVGT